jgi:hypothetical protein
MECDICGQDVKNSEDLQKHKERVHATDVGDNLERPDLLEDPPEESAASEIPKAARSSDLPRVRRGAQEVSR